MDKTALFALRREGERKFDKVSELRLFLNDFLGKKLTFPMVVGYESFGEKEWEVKDLLPLTPSTELTVKNYLECLRNLEQGKESDEFKGRILYQAVESFHYDNWDSNILFVDIVQVGEKSALQTFDLDFYFSHICTGSSNEKVGYEAVSRIPPTRLEEHCGRFQGPNNHYRRVLN